MELHTALRLLDLPNTPSPEDVQSAYRRLVMRYHPDRNPRRAEWAHTMTTRVYEAYVVASEFAKTRRSGGRSAGEGGPTRATGAGNEKHAQSRRSRSSRPTSFHDAERAATRSRTRSEGYAATINRCRRYFEDAVHYYYTHRLDKAYLRGDGSQHLRYRRAVRHLKQAAQSCASIPAEGPSSQLSLARERLVAVAVAFARCAARPAPLVPQAGGKPYAAYQHLMRGIEYLDGAICAALCPDLKIGTAPWNSGSRSSLSFHELMVVFTTYRVSPWVDEAAARLELLDAFAAYSANSRQ